MKNTAFVALSLVLLPLLPATAQQPHKDGDETRTARAPRQTISLDFAGGTLAEYVAGLRGVGQNVNIVLPELASRVRVPPLALRETSVEAALRAVTHVVDPGFQLGINVSQGSSPHAGPIGEPVYSVQIRQVVTGSNRAPASAGTSPSGRNVRVFALRHLIKDGAADAAYRLDVKTILTAVDTGLAVVTDQVAVDEDPQAPKAIVRYHEDSALLFVAGTSPQLRVIEEVISSLAHSTQAERAPRSGTLPPAESKAEPAGDEKKKAAR
jgi:hypothetical protein